MGKFKLLVIAAVTMAMTIGLAGMAFAAKQGGCGWCHGTGDNSAFGNMSGKNIITTRVTATADNPFGESSLTPQVDNKIRGLHGIHMNYSSATYGKGGTTRGTCNYCHNGHPRHESGFVNFTTAARNKGSIGRQPLLDNISGTANGKRLMLYTSAGRGTSEKNNISSMDEYPTGTCTKACHKGTSQSNPAPWGEFTDPSIKLTCNSCHGDASDYGVGKVNNTLGNGASGTGGHKVHLYSPGGSHANQLLGGTKIVLGTFSTVFDMNGNSNKACAACHPDNTAEGKGANDTGAKSYPHATDGTNVKVANVNFTAPGGIVFTQTTGIATATTSLSCTNNCHFNKSSVQLLDPKWKDSSGCELCHNHTPKAGVNISATRPLSYAHTLHFQAISSMHIGGNSGLDQNGVAIAIPGLPSCNDCHTEAHTVNAVGGPQLYQVPVKDGAAGIRSTTDTLTTDTHGANGTFTNPGWSASGTISTSGTCTNRCHTTGSPAWNTIATNSTATVAGCAACHSYPQATVYTFPTFYGSTTIAQAIVAYPTKGYVDPSVITDWNKGAIYTPGTAGNKKGIWTLPNGKVVNSNGHTANGDQTAGAASSLRHLGLGATYDKINDTYAGVTGDTAKCGKCHNNTGNTHMNGTIDVNPASSGPASGFTLTNRTPGSSVQCNDAKCHFRRTTPNW